MSYTASVKADLRREATNIWLKIIDGIEKAIIDNVEVFYLHDVLIMGDPMTCMLKKENWESSLEKARLYFENLEEYDLCKKCRDLKRKISQPQS